MGGTLAFSWGKYGGFYYAGGYTKHLVLGWIAFTYIPKDLDVLLGELIEEAKKGNS